MELPLDGPANRRHRKVELLWWATTILMGSWICDYVLAIWNDVYANEIGCVLGGVMVFSQFTLWLIRREWKKIRAQFEDEMATHYLGVLSGRTEGAA